MFERYTEKARRVIFFARYEASDFGSPYIETEHLLLGLLREDPSLSYRFLSAGDAEQIRTEIRDHTTQRERTPTSVDLPLSNEGKRILAHAAEIAEWAGHRHIGTEHLLAGILAEEHCFAAELLRQRGLTLENIRERLKSSQPDLQATSGIGGGGGSMRVRTSTPPLDFVCRGQSIASAYAIAPPRIGEHIAFSGSAGEKRYRVFDVTYHYELPPELPATLPSGMEKALAGHFSTAAHPLKITIDVEQEGTDSSDRR